MAAEIADEYRSSLSELSFNSKPHINMLTMLAEENINHAPVIVKTIVDHINSVTPDIKLPSLYLVDSIVKNVGEQYIDLFGKHLVKLFSSVFEKVDENIRSLLYKLRSTWIGVFSNPVLYDLDKRIICLDPAWPVSQPAPKNIHVNPKFLDKPCAELPKQSETLTKSQCALLEVEMKKQQLVLLKALEEKEKKLMELKQLKAATQSKVDNQKKGNTRDPRLAKKISLATASDGTTLQSVVVIPKVNPKRKKDTSLSPVSKKTKLGDSVDLKKDVKLKSMEYGVNSNVNIDHSTLNQQSNSTHTLNAQKDMKIKKQPLEHEASDPSHSVNKSDQLPKFPADLKTGSDSILRNKISVTLNQSNKPVIKIAGSHNSAALKEGDISEEKSYCNLQSTIISNEEMFDKNTRKLEPPPLPPLFLGNEDKDYRILPNNLDVRNLNDTTYHKRMTVPVVKSFKLDNKERKVYFVNERSFAFLDDNIPRELTFGGSPQRIFIEGLLQPIELGFGGHKVKFEYDGRFHFIKFGTPAREVYIDDYPYEASFGGLPFTAILEHGKVRRIKISGPAPKVVLSTAPAYDLYEKFCQNNREFLRRFDNEPYVNHIYSAKVPVANHDIDMRVNNGEFSSTFFDFPLEKMCDLNWQRIHVGNSQQTEWNVPKNSFETYKDVSPNFLAHRNYSKGSDWNRSLPLSEVQNSALNMPPPLPPKKMINRYPAMPPSTTFGPTYSVNTPLQHCSRSVPPNSGLFSQPMNNGGDFLIGPRFNEAPAIPKLSPPPLPPFLGTIPSTSCMTALSINKELAQAPVSYCSSTMPATLPFCHTAVSVPPVNIIPMPVSSHTATLVTNTIISTQMLSSTIPVQVPNVTVPVQETTSTISAALNTAPVNINLVLEKLVAAGIIGKNSGNSSSPASTDAATSSDSEKNEGDSKDEPSKEDTEPQIVFESKCLKQYYPSVIDALHNGSQCANCGMRFKDNQREQYRLHLDWHFRRIQHEKVGAKKPFSRRLFYEVKDWVEFEEFEDVDERAPSYFDLQANGEQTAETLPEVVRSVACSGCESEKCAVCGEEFQMFWAEQEEEWHLKNAVQHNNQAYHPACYEDYEKINNSISIVPTSSLDEKKMNVDTVIEELASPIKVKTEKCEDKEEEESKFDIDDNVGMPEDGEKEEKVNGSHEKEKVEEEEEEEERCTNEENELEVELKDLDVDIKVEPMDTEEVEIKESAEDKKSETNAVESEEKKTEVIKTESIVEPPLKSGNVNGEPILTSQTVPIKSEDDLEDDEFHPPTPDPRFQVLPPVSKGTEISNLCTIM